MPQIRFLKRITSFQRPKKAQRIVGSPSGSPAELLENPPLSLPILRWVWLLQTIVSVLVSLPSGISPR